jgi:uncharacterized protein YggE
MSRLTLCFALLPVLLLAASSARGQIGFGNAAADRGVHVAGKGMVKVVPDLVTINLKVETIDDDLVRVRQTSDKQAQTILGYVKKQGAPETAFQVTSLDISFGHNEQLKRQIYTVTRELSLRLADLAKLDALLADLLTQPNLKVKAIVFGTSRERELEFEARSRAITDAREKAKQLAELNGLKLGRAYDVRVESETQVPFVTSVIPVVGAAESSELPTATTPRPARFPGATLVQAGVPAAAKSFGMGEIEITAEVFVDFELKE